MVIEKFDKYNEYTDVISSLSALAEKKEYFFRGYNKSSEMLPKLIRKNDYMEYEGYCLKEFEKRGCSYYNANSPMDFLSYAQHFGLPTRLLDYTENPFVALAFALHSDKRGCKGEEAEYYYINVSRKNEHIIIEDLPNEKSWNDIGNTSFAKSVVGSFNFLNKVYKENFNDNLILINHDNPSNEEIRALNEKIRNRALLFVTPNASNQRIVMQQGLFMIPSYLEKDKLLELIEEKTDKIMIHKGLRYGLLDYLDTIGINTFKLMPDLSNVCGAIEWNMEKNRKKHDEEYPLVDITSFNI